MSIYSPSTKKTVWEIAEERHSKRDDEAVLNALQIRRDLDDFDIKELAKVRQWSKQLGIDTSEMEKAFWDKTNDVYDVKEILYKLSDKVDDAVNAWQDKLLDVTFGLRTEAHRYSLSDVEKEISDWLATNKPVPGVVLQDSMSALQKFKTGIQNKINSLKKSAVVRPNDLSDAFVDIGSWMNDDQKVDNILKNVDRLLGTGTADKRYRELKSIAHKVRPYGTGGSLYGQASSSPFVYNQILEYVNAMNGGAREVMTSINHLKELNRAADLDRIPFMWRKKFNDYIKVIESHDIATNGYYGIYREIEGAYNIYKLSTSQNAIAYGLGRLSVNTPYQLLDEFKKKGIDFVNYDTRLVKSDGKTTKITKKIVNAMPRKDFFDSMDKFIPFQTNGLSGHGAYYHPTYQHVVMNLDNSLFVTRMKASAEHAEFVFYHEFGHAKDDLYGNYKKMKDWNDLFDKFAPKVDSKLKNIKTGEFRQTKEHYTINAKMEKSGKYSYEDIDELVGSLEDILQAMVSDHRRVGKYGHNYLAQRDNQISEFIAHCFEVYWRGNSAIEQYLPDLYKEMKAIMKKYK